MVGCINNMNNQGQSMGNYGFYFNTMGLLLEMDNKGERLYRYC